MERVSIKGVKMKYEPQLMRLPNVTSVRIGAKGGKEAIKVFVRSKMPESTLRKEELIPKSLEGYEVDAEEIGTVIAQS